MTTPLAPQAMVRAIRGLKLETRDLRLLSAVESTTDKPTTPRALLPLTKGQAAVELLARGAGKNSKPAHETTITTFRIFENPTVRNLNGARHLASTPVTVGPGVTLVRMGADGL